MNPLIRAALLLVRWRRAIARRVVQASRNASQWRQSDVLSRNPMEWSHAPSNYR